MATLRKLLLFLVLLAALSCWAGAESENPVLEAAGWLLPKLPARHRLELVEAWASRGNVEQVRILQQGWSDRSSDEAREGQAWLALLDEKVPFPPTTDPSKLLLECPNLKSLKWLLAAFPIHHAHLVRAAYHYEDKDSVRILLLQAELAAVSEGVTDLTDIARAYLLLDDLTSVRRLDGRFSLSDPVLREWIGTHDDDPELYFPDFLSSGREELRDWRRESAELIALRIYRGESQEVHRLMDRAWLGQDEVIDAAGRLAHRDLRLAVAKHFGDVREEAAVRLPSVDGEERESLLERVTNVPDGGDGYPDFNVPAYFLKQLNTDMSRATFDALYQATLHSVLGLPGIQRRRHYDDQFLLLHQAYDPTEQLRRLVYGETDSLSRFRTLIRLGRYYPSRTWPILPADRELLKALQARRAQSRRSPASNCQPPSHFLTAVGRVGDGRKSPR